MSRRSAFSRDLVLLFAARSARLIAYGALSIVLVLYLTTLGLTTAQSGFLLTLVLAGDIAVSLFLTTRADRLGRRKVLVAGGILMAGAGLGFALTHDVLCLIIAGTIGVISPSGAEVGPFLPVEQAALAHIVDAGRRTSVFAWYTLAGSLATATGSIGGGVLVTLLQRGGSTPVASYRAIVLLYAAVGLLLVATSWMLSPAVEPGSGDPGLPGARSFLGVHESRGTVFRLSGLFALDAFAGGFVVQSLAAYWFYLRFGLAADRLGAIFFGANLLAGVSALVASRLAARFGLINTMVFTHLPSNVLLIFVPLMPNVELAVILLFIRFSISQMDVPTRQSYVMAVVRPDERSAAAGITGVARTAGAALAPAIAGWMLARPEIMNLPFFVAGGLKIVYDLALYRSFVAVRPPGTGQQ